MMFRGVGFSEKLKLPVVIACSYQEAAGVVILLSYNVTMGSRYNPDSSKMIFGGFCLLLHVSVI